MKKIIITLLIASGLVSCDDAPTTGNVSKITNYPIITVTGDDPYFVAKGTTYVDPGAVAMAGTNEVPVITTAVGKYRGGNTLDTNITDEYLVTYSAKNSDGFAGTASRKVIVYKTGDLVTSLEGVYISTASRNGASPVTAQNNKYVHIWKNADGTYELSDAFGGWYEYHRGFGVGYVTPGALINAVSIPTNTFTYPGNPFSNAGFGGTANILDVTVNPVNKKIVLTVSWLAPTAYTFVVTLTQVQL